MTGVVWFKRDLRVHDHAPLCAAVQYGPVLALYVHEPSLLHSPLFDAAHGVFIAQSLAALDTALAQRGNRLLQYQGEVVPVLQALHQATGFTRLWSHEETGQRLTWDRDRAVAGWCRARGVHWTELAQNGVVRRLRSRDGWAARWNQRMALPQVAAPGHVPAHPLAHLLAHPLAQMPAQIPAQLPGQVAARPAPHSAALYSPANSSWAGANPGPDARPTAPALSARFGQPKPAAQPGGEPAAQALLHDFLQARGVDYRRGMSSPLSAERACSRLSPHLAWGTVSLRTVSQAADARADALATLHAVGAPVDVRWPAAVRSFQSRLRWHCHFMQKLEDDPRIEFENFSHACDGLRPDPGEPGWRADAFDAWCAGRTGFPMVDACMRALLATGWINFRMRAMLMSFAAYHLWLHWRQPALYLARQFLDFEPGIHFSQCQMQSGTTGINTLRIYSPTRQAQVQDPDGVFIRRWLPELAAVPAGFVHEPWRMPPGLQQRSGCLLGQHYPAPLVDADNALRTARERWAAVRASPAAQAEADALQQRHGSRKSGLAPVQRGPSGVQHGQHGQRGMQATGTARRSAPGPAGAAPAPAPVQLSLWDPGES